MLKSNQNGNGIILKDGSHSETYEHYVKSGKMNILKCDYNNKYCLPMHNIFKYQIIKSSMKTGKTFQVINFLKDCISKNLTFLITSPRITFARDITSRLKVAGIDIGCYLNSEDKEEDKLGYCISAESMFKLKRIYDVVIIDECESFLNQFSSGLHGNNLDLNRDMITMQIRNSKRTVAMDADADIRIISYFQDIVDKDILDKPSIANEYHVYYSENHYKAETNMHCYMYPMNDTIYKLQNILSTTESNIQIVLGSKEFGLKVIEPLLIELGINYIFHHGGSDDQSNITNNINVGWKSFRVVMYTSTVGPGINFDEDHFDYRFVFGASLSVSVREVFQMKGRVRNISSGIEYVCNSTRKDTFPCTYEDVVRDLKFKINEDNMQSVEASNFLKPIKYIVKSLKNKVVWDLDLSNIWVRLHIYHIVEVNKSRNSYNYEYVTKTCNSGSKFTKIEESELSKDDNEIMSDEIIKMKKSYKLKAKANYDEAKVHDKKDLNELIQNIKEGKATAVQKLELAKSLHNNRLIDATSNTFESNQIYINHKAQIDNLTSEVRLTSIGSYILNDLKEKPSDIIQKRKLSRRLEIDTLLASLFGKVQGLNSFNRDLKVTNFEILERCKYLFEPSNYLKIITIFGLTKRREPSDDNDWKWLVKLASDMLTKWSCCKLGGSSGPNNRTAQRVKSKGNPDVFIYNLLETVEGFDELFKSIVYNPYNISETGIIEPQILTNDRVEYEYMRDCIEASLIKDIELVQITNDDDERQVLRDKRDVFLSVNAEVMSDDDVMEEDVIGPDEEEATYKLYDEVFMYYNEIVDSVEDKPKKKGGDKTKSKAKVVEHEIPKPITEDQLKFMDMAMASASKYTR